MFKRIMAAICLGLGALCVFAQVGVLSLTDEDKHTQKEDFWHTFEYYIMPAKSANGQIAKCQATRVAKNWFATAAHCVADKCRKECTLRMDLLEQPVSVFVDGKHSPQKPIVFVHPDYVTDKSIAHDFALIKMDLSLLPFRYYRRPTGKETENVGISRGEFEQFIKQNPTARREFNRALRPDLPPILVFDNVTGRIDRKLSVISIFGGKRSILKNPHPTDYVKELGFAYTQNFGVKQGMSGSGVMTNTGELAGIISAYLVVQMSDGKQNDPYFMFPVFNKELTDFMQETMNGDYSKIERKDASPNYVVRSPKNHRAFIEAVRNMQKKK